MTEQNHFAINFKLFNPLEATSQEWNALHSYRKRYYAENTSDFPPIDDQTYVRRITASHSNPNTFYNSYEILLNQEIIGALGIRFEKDSSPSYENKKNELFFSLKFLKQFRQRGLGSQVLTNISALASENKRSLLVTNSFEEDGKIFLRRIGAEEASIVRRNKLEFNNIDWNMVKSWYDEAERKNPELQLKLFSTVPDELLESFCEAATFISSQVPQDNLQTGNIIVTPKMHRGLEEMVAKVGHKLETAVIIDKNNRVLGLTFMIYDITANYFDQQLTGVLLDYRGKKLGKWLKAGLLLHVREKYPGFNYILSENAESNDAMLAINDRLGFKSMREEIFFQISLDQLNQYLKSKNLLVES